MVVVTVYEMRNGDGGNGLPQRTSPKREGECSGGAKVVRRAGIVLLFEGQGEERVRKGHEVRKGKSVTKG